jgi:sugar lactone lactonase YvrE
MRKFTFLLALAALVSSIAPAQVITTFAGNGFDSSGLGKYGGDGGPATAAELYDPYSVAVDSSGNVFIADRQNNRIRKVNTSGTISAIAGSDSIGYSGDGGPATAATLAGPSGVAIDHSGNVYIADQLNNRVRMVSTSGIITTIAGNDMAGYAGDGGPATAAWLSAPVRIAVDRAGDVYIDDISNYRIRMIDHASGIITTIAGNGAAGYSGDGGPATAATLYAGGLVLDNAGNVYFADGQNNRVRKINDSGIITTIAGNGTGGYSGDGGAATLAELYAPGDIALDDSGNVYIVEFVNAIVRKINASGLISTLAGNGSQGYSGDGGPATAAEMYTPTGIATDRAGNIYVADFGNNVIRKINPYISAITAVSPVSATIQKIALYPNPTQNTLTVSSTGIITNITITNIIGKIVYAHDSHSKNVEVDAVAFPPGIYFVRINGSDTRKFVKE